MPWLVQKCGNFIREVKSLHYATVKNDHSRDLTVSLTRTFGLGFEHIKVNAQNLISAILYCIAFNCIHINAVFTFIAFISEL
jgi:hypothetical protein